ncbi:MAG: hypothetical protein JWL90_4081 [Chthoniobacteraceae bacterium]|nr:hypothetical protein [Chthoniobacteraceae bacterium]MDB6172837.1 hypothetical protein [Chthoniobacteraceae bacterium]
MKSVLFPLFLLAGGLLAHADFVIVQKVEGSMQSGTMTLKFKESKARADVAPEMSTITDGATGEVITLMHVKKGFMRIPAESTQALTAEMQKRQKTGPKGADLPKLVSNGKKEKIENRECEVFTWNGTGVSATYWVARDYPNYAAISAAMEKCLNSGLAALSLQMTPRPNDFPGMVMKTEMLINGQKVTTTLVSVSDQNLDAALFTVPVDYKELPSPSFNFPIGK